MPTTEYEQESSDDNDVTTFINQAVSLPLQVRATGIVPEQNQSLMTHILFWSSLLVACPSGVPFYKAAADFAGSDTTLGKAMGASTIICFGNLTVWTNRMLFHEILSIVDEGERLSSNSRQKRFFLIASFILGALTSIPQLYITYEFNNKNLFWPIFTFVTFCGFPTFGTYRFLMKSRDWYRYFCDILENSYDVVSVSNSYKEEQIRALEVVSDNFNLLRVLFDDVCREVNVHSSIRADEFLSKSDRISIGEQNREIYTFKTYKLFMMAAFSLATCTLVFNFLLTRAVFIKELGMSDALSTFLASLAEIPVAGVVYTGCYFLMRTIFSKFYESIFMSDKRNLVEQSFSNSKFIFKFMVFLVSGFSFGVNAAAIKKLGIKHHEIIVPLIAVSDVFFHFTGLLSNADFTFELLQDCMTKADTEIQSLIHFRNSLFQVSERVSELNSKEMHKIGFFGREYVDEDHEERYGTELRVSDHEARLLEQQ